MLVYKVHLQYLYNSTVTDRLIYSTNYLKRLELESFEFGMKGTQILQIPPLKSGEIGG